MRSPSSSLLSLFLLFALTLLTPTLSRPNVRTIRDTQQFDKLLSKHATETGLPIILDFYSDGCGPCRQIAPAFQKLAKEYAGRAVFAKVDVNKQHQISQRYGVRSMPTFVFIVDGKKINEFSGAGEGQLRQFTKVAVDKAEASNVKLTVEALAEFYAANDPLKGEDAVQQVIDKCVEQVKLKGNKECVGGAASELARKLKKKYKVQPKIEKRFTAVENDETADSTKSKPTTDSKKKNSSSTSAPESKAKSANLDLATKEELKLELEKRIEADLEAAEEAKQDDDDFNAVDVNAYVKSDFPERVVIIGGGPAGMSAAIYAARAGLRPIIVAPPLGGQLQGKGVDVENYPGLQLQTGPGIVSSMREQAILFGTKFEGEEVVRIDSSVRPFKVYTNSSVIETHGIILATGADSKWLGIKGEWELRGGGVSSCATCDGYLFRDEHVIVVGGGDTAMEDALVLARTSKHVTVVHRGSAFRASEILARRVNNHPSISVRFNSVVKEIHGKTITLESSPNEDRLVVSHITLIHNHTSPTGASEEEISCAAVFVAIGHSPNTQIVEGIVEFNPAHPGYVSLVPGTTATSVAGIFASGDVADAIYRQAITSAGSGAAAALDCERWLDEEGLGNEEEEWEAEILREMMMEEGESVGAESFNVYGEGNVGVGRKEEVGEVKKKGKKDESLGEGEREGSETNKTRNGGEGEKRSGSGSANTKTNSHQIHDDSDEHIEL